MARGRGGPRDGVTGRNYANRADLRGANVVAAQPQNQPGQKMAAQAASGQPYGAASAQMAAQKALPIANPGTPAPTAPQGQPAPQRAPLTPLDAPTTHGLPLHTGLDKYDGAGSEALIQPTPNDPAAQALSLLNTLGDNVSPQVAYIRTYLATQTKNQMPQ